MLIITDLVQVPPEILPSYLAEVFNDKGGSYSKLESTIKEIASDPKYAEQRAVDEFKRLAGC